MSTLVNKRMEECLSCDEWFARIPAPAHPAWEWAYCPACRMILGVVWSLAYVEPRAVQRVIRAEAV